MSKKQFWGQLIKIVLVNLFVLLMIVLLVFFPRHLNIQNINGVYTADYTFEFDVFKYRVKWFFDRLIENKGLGYTPNGLSIHTEIGRMLGRSLQVIVTALMVSVFMGIWKGIFDYNSTHKKRNFLGNGTTWLISSIPDFLLLLILQWFIIRYVPFIKYFTHEGWHAFILPALTVAIYPTLYIARITSSTVASHDSELYVLFAKSKGLTKRMVFYRHIFRNSIGTIVTHLPTLALYILSNLLIVEYLMEYKGAAYGLYRAIDYSVQYGTGYYYNPVYVVGILTCFVFIILIVQIISHIALQFIEPRLEEKE